MRFQNLLLANKWWDAQQEKYLRLSLRKEVCADLWAFAAGLKLCLTTATSATAILNYSHARSALHAFQAFALFSSVPLHFQLCDSK